MRFKALIISVFITTLLFSQQKPKIALVLSGGGAKGIAHIGVLRVLESKGIKPDIIVGTSMGALVGAFYAVGYSPDELEEIVKTIDWDYLLNDEIRRENLLIGQGNKNKNTILSLPLDGLKPEMSSGLYKGQNILTFFEIKLREYSGEQDFDKLPIKFRCIATNIETGKAKVFSKGNLAEVVRASMSIPSVFNPYEINGQLYVDGGIVNNFPTDIAKQMGADIIIGVDVGAVLYKKEEINSIIKILDQTSSFYNYRIAQKNKELCDIYLRPDITGISALSFTEIDTIIARGTKVAKENINKIDSVFGKYNLQAIPTDTNIIDKNIIIDNIIINPTVQNSINYNGARKLIDGKLSIKTPETLTETELSNRINRLYGSKFFEEVLIEFDKKDTSYSLIVNAKEQRKNSFNIGIRYDDIYGINVLVGASFRNLMIYGSLLELRIVAGQSPQFRARYSTDRGSSLGFGTSIEYNNFDVYTYNDKSDIIAKYNYNRAVGDLFIHSYLGSYNRIVIGTEFSAFLLSETQAISDIAEMKNNFFNIYGSYIVDTWDRAYYPNSGFKFKLRNDFIFHENDKMLNTAWGKANLVFPISKKIKILVDGFVGYGSGNIDTTLFRYEVGGLASNRIEWYNSFPGLRYLEHGSNNVWIAKVSPRYEFYKNNFITGTFAIMAMDNIFENLFITADRMYTGLSLKYGFYSMFGPMEISMDYSFNNYRKNYFISLGYWF